MEKWIEDYVERETLMATQRVVDAETAIKQEQEVMRNAEKVGLITKQPETTFEEMLNAIRDSLTNLATSDDGEDGEYEDDHSEDLELGKMSEHDKPGWVMGTFTKTVLPRKDRFQQKPMELDELTQQGCWDRADNFCERDEKDGMTELNVPAVIQLHTEDDAASFAPIPFGKPMETLDSISRNIANAPSGFSTRKLSYEARFPETLDRQTHSVYLARHSARFITDSEIEACWTCRLSPLYIVSLADYHIQIGVGQRNRNGSCVPTDVNEQIAIVGGVSLRKAIRVPILLCVSFYLISVTKLWDMIICLCICKGRMGHANVLDCKLCRLMTTEHHIVMLVTVKSEYQHSIRDETH